MKEVDADTAIARTVIQQTKGEKRMNVMCPHCRAVLKIEHRNVGREARCVICGGTFTIQDAPTRINLGASRFGEKGKFRAFVRGRRSLLYCLLLGAGAMALLLGFLWAIRNRYALVKSDRGVVYRTDRVTGETMMIRGARMYQVTQEQESRRLTHTELSKVTGRGGKSFDGHFSVSLYNGNADITVTSVKIGLTHIGANGQKFVRQYRTEMVRDGAPLSVFSASFEFVKAEETRDYVYPWRVLDAKGVPNE